MVAKLRQSFFFFFFQNIANFLKWKFSLNYLGNIKTTFTEDIDIGMQAIKCQEVANHFSNESCSLGFLDKKIELYQKSSQKSDYK